jgi:hypothetical protein
VSQAPNDKQEMEPALTNLKRLPQALGTVTEILADNGFFSEDNVLQAVAELRADSYLLKNKLADLQGQSAALKGLRFEVSKSIRSGIEFQT